MACVLKKGFGNSFPKPFLYRKVHVIVLAGNSVFYTNGKSVGHSFMQIPVKFIESLKVDLGKEEDVREIFYNKEKEAISRGKFYFLPEEYDIVFQNRDL